MQNIEELQAENVVLREALETMHKFDPKHQHCLACKALSATQHTAKAQAVLKAAKEYAELPSVGSRTTLRLKLLARNNLFKMIREMNLDLEEN